MKWCVVIASPEPETMFNAVRLCNKALDKGEEVSLFLLGAAVDYEQLSSERFDLKGQVAAFQERGDFYV
jgi:uncharacterized protein involved in oxidation of intracellular sulfur